MPQAIERGRHDEQVHQVTVIGDEVVQAAASQSSRDRAGRASSVRQASPWVWPAAVCRRNARSSTLRPSTTSCRTNIAPRRRGTRRRPPRSGRAGARRCRASRPPRAALRAPSPRRCDEAGAEQEHQAEKQRAKRARHGRASPAAASGPARRASPGRDRPRPRRGPATRPRSSSRAGR